MRLWALRFLGVVLLIVGWLTVAIPQFGSSHFFVATVVFASLGLGAFAVAIMARRVAVDLERKLRLRLLVHNMELENLTMRDGLTQLFNRHYLLDRLERELESAKISDQPLALLLIDIDFFKSVNDSFGLQVGDQVLASFGRLLLDYTRATDIPARLGGDEFGVVLPGTPKRGAKAMVERLTEALANASLIEIKGSSPRITASFGMAGYPWGADTVDSLVQQAESSLLVSKQSNQRASDALIDEIPAAFRQSIDDILDQDPRP